MTVGKQMREFDFFADCDRTIASAEVLPGAESPCLTNSSKRSNSSALAPVGDARARVILDDGASIDVGVGVLVGRKPTPTEDFDTGTEMVALSDDQGLISRNHLAIYPGPAGLVARDLGSTNGTTLRRGERSAEMPPNKAVNVRAGDQLELGSRIIEIG